MGKVIMKHTFEECEIKLKAIHSLAGQIKAGMKADTIESHVIIMLAEEIQYDAELLRQEDK